jgi:hypothetical protein
MRVRGLFAGNAFVALEVCDTRDFDGTLGEAGARLTHLRPFSKMAYRHLSRMRPLTPGFLIVFGLPNR